MRVVGPVFQFFVPRLGGNCLTNEANPFSARREWPEDLSRAARVATAVFSCANLPS